MKFSIRYKFAVGFLLIFCASFNCITLFINKVVIKNNEKVICDQFLDSQKDLDVYLSQYIVINKIAYNEEGFGEYYEKIGTAVNSKINDRIMVYSKDGKLMFDSDYNSGNLYLRDGTIINDDYSDLNSAINGQAAYKIINANIVNTDNSSLDYSSNPLEVINKESFGDVQGLTKNFGFINDNEVLLGCGLSREDFYKKYPNEIDKSNSENNKLLDEQLNDQYGKMYRFNLADGTKKPLNIDTRDVYSDLMSGANKFSYVSKNKFYMYDLNNDSKTEYRSIDDTIGSEYMGVWSKDGKCLISYENENINVYNVLDNTSKSFKVGSNDMNGIHVYMMPGYYSDNGEEVYFLGVKYNKNTSRTGIYKLNCDNGEVKEVFLLPPTDHTSNNGKESGIPSNDYCVLENGKRIIFNGTIEGVDGTYIYDVEDDKYYNVIPTTVKSEYGSYSPQIWVSPDKTKVVYMNLADEEGTKHWNLYAARINGNNLVDRICLYKNINLCGENITWSPDSKKILFFSANEDIVKNYISFKDKNEVNIITFK